MSGSGRSIGGPSHTDSPQTSVGATEKVTSAPPAGNGADSGYVRNFEHGHRDDHAHGVRRDVPIERERHADVDADQPGERAHKTAASLSPAATRSAGPTAPGRGGVNEDVPPRSPSEEEHGPAGGQGIQHPNNPGHGEGNGREFINDGADLGKVALVADQLYTALRRLKDRS